jgi:hypothetical protein
LGSQLEPSSNRFFALPPYFDVKSMAAPRKFSGTSNRAPSSMTNSFVNPRYHGENWKVNVAHRKSHRLGECFAYSLTLFLFFFLLAWILKLWPLLLQGTSIHLLLIQVKITVHLTLPIAVG